MEPLAAPVDRDALRAELSSSTLLIETRMGKHELHLVDGRRCPAVLEEVGRLRELTYRALGSASGKPTDLDALDTDESSPYEQLVIYSPEEREIVGGTRVKQPTGPHDRIASESIFAFSDRFRRDYFPHILDVGRMFIIPRYQSAEAGRKGLFVLDNMLEGLGLLGSVKKDLHHFFGRIVARPTLDPLVRDLTLFYLERHCPDPDALLAPKAPLGLKTPRETLEGILHANDRDEDMRLLQLAARERNERPSGLLRAYLNLSPNMRTFGTAADYDIGGIEETALLITIADTSPKQRERYIEETRARWLSRQAETATVEERP